MKEFPHTKKVCEAGDCYCHDLYSANDLQQMLAERDQVLPYEWLKGQWQADSFYLGAVHFATIEERRELLDLWLKLGETFTGVHYVEAVNGLVESPYEAAWRVLDLMNKASLEMPEEDRVLFKEVKEAGLSEDDRRTFREAGIDLPENPNRMDYLRVAPLVEEKFKCAYLRNASRIVAAQKLLGCISDFYTQCEWRAKRFNEAAGINAELDILSVWRHPVQRFRLARELLAKLDVAYENATYVQLCNERVIEMMRLCYAGEYYHGFPLAKRAVALREYKAEFFDDAELQALATAEWESSSIYKQFGEENILRAHMLQRYVNHRITFYRPVMAGAVSSFRRCYTESEVHKLYPELPEELYVYCYFG